ncbi:hypothetical protein RF11_08608 [Thelohanellus kitauei]|uniref:Uncharacterized protein n=1 Tax=Thelohanellus kitauei TaxID=669202 RepID=A0A0C2MGH7_THEKT|nr:hypothetical protein RF11_08608 [Thelohanellus kitauei]
MSRLIGPRKKSGWSESTTPPTHGQSEILEPFGMSLPRRCVPIPRRKERGSKTSLEGQAPTRAQKKEKPIKAPGYLHDRWHSYRHTKAWSRLLRCPDSCATAVATGVKSLDSEGSTSSSTYKSRS